MAYIGRDAQYGSFEVQTLTPDSSTVTFNLTYAVGSAGSILVVYGGVLQQPGTSYGLANGGTQIVFSEAPVTGTTLFIIYSGKQLSSPAPSTSGPTLTANTSDTTAYYLPLSIDVVGTWTNAVVDSTLTFVPSSNKLQVTDGMIVAGNSSVNVQVNSTSIAINGGVGSNGQVMTSNGTATIWANSSGGVTALTGTNNQITVSGSTGAVTISAPQNLHTGANFQINSLGVGTAGSNTTGEIRATNNITAYYSSDEKLKENIEDVPNALDVVVAIGSKQFDWTDAYVEQHGGADGYFIQKHDFGVVAQDVQKVFPSAVRTRPDGTLAVDYEKLGTLSFGAIQQLLTRIEALEQKLK